MMQDPDLKCRHFGILWRFMAFYGISWHFGIFAKKSNKKSNPIFLILSDFFRLKLQNAEKIPASKSCLNFNF